MSERSVITRFWAKVDVADDSECWPWQAAHTRNGYGTFHPTKTSAVMAHRFAYELTVGPIPVGLRLDHVCHSAAVVAGGCTGGVECPHRRCCNPAHLEPVTQQENVRRGVKVESRRTHCPRGHLYDEENTRIDVFGKRRCRACARKGGPRPGGRGPRLHLRGRRPT